MMAIGSDCAEGRGISSPCRRVRLSDVKGLSLTRGGIFIYNVDTMAEQLGALEQAVLVALVRPQTELGKEAYGRAILKEVQHRLGRDVAAGAVYSTLDRLEAKGLVSSRLGLGTPVRGGLTYREAHLAMERIAEADGLSALEVVEINTVLDVNNRTAQLGVELILSALGKTIL